MKRFEFRLQRMLEFQRQLKRDAEIRHQRVRGELESTAAEILALHQQLDQLTNAAGQAAQFARLNGNQYAVRIGEQIEETSRRLHEIHKELHHTNREAVQAATQAEALQTLRDGEFEIHRRDVFTERHNQADDNAMLKWRVDHRHTPSPGKDLP